MGTLTLFMHTSLDGFAAGFNGEMDWIHVDDEIFDHGANRIYATDQAIYGRKTFQLMDSYWPTAALQPEPARHVIEHSRWYEETRKVVLSNSLKGQEIANTLIINDDLDAQINKLKQSSNKEILIFGSPAAAHSLMARDLIDQYWFNVNPVVIGQGIPVFKEMKVKGRVPMSV